MPSVDEKAEVLAWCQNNGGTACATWYPDESILLEITGFNVVSWEESDFEGIDEHAVWHDAYVWVMGQKGSEA